MIAKASNHHSQPGEVYFNINCPNAVENFELGLNASFYYSNGCPFQEKPIKIFTDGITETYKLAKSTACCSRDVQQQRPGQNYVNVHAKELKLLLQSESFSIPSTLFSEEYRPNQNDQDACNVIDFHDDQEAKDAYVAQYNTHNDHFTNDQAKSYYLSPL